MSQHTPGPWKVQPNRQGIMFSGSAGFSFIPWGNQTPISIADARLIAKAPEMLENLENVTAALENVMVHFRDRMPHADKIGRSKLLDDARALLTEIEG